MRKRSHLGRPGEHRERKPHGPGQGVIHLYANFSMEIRTSRLQG